MSELSPEAREQLAPTEPTEPGWYSYSGGAEVMIFHLRKGGQWSVHLDNGTAADCVWGYIEQALGVWDLVRIGPSIVTAAVEAERARIVSAVEAVGEFDAWLTVAPGVRVRVMHAHDVRTTLASAAPALDAVKAEAEVKALREAADAIQSLHPGEVKNSVAFLRDRADRIARGSRTTDETEA